MFVAQISFMAKVSDLLKLVFEKAGFDLKDPAFADLLLIQADVQDDKVESVKKYFDGLLTLDAAKNHIELENHFKNKALLPLDSEIAKTLDEYKFDDEAKKEFLQEKSTYKKVKRLQELLLEKARNEEKSKYSNVSKTQETLQKEIDRLNNEILNEKNSYVQKENEVKKQANETIKNFALRSLLSNKQYADGIPESIRITGALDLIQKELQKKGAKAVFNDDYEFALVQEASPDLKYMDNNKEVSFTDFIDKTLADNAMLKIQGQTQQAAGGTTQQQQSFQTDRLPQSNVAALRELEAAMAQQ